MKTSIRKASAYIFSILMICAAILHAYWAIGGSWFVHEASGGAIEPGAPLSLELRLMTWAMIALMIIAALLAMGRVNIIRVKIPQWLFSVSCWVMTVCMFLGAVLNFSISRFWDRFVFGPIFLLLFVLIFIVALPERRAA
jgi:hypothetical protein